MITAIPAIDLIGGHIVRLAKGDFSKVTQYGSTPAEITKEFDALGFKRLHVVDLDAAGRKGRDNIATLREITSATSMKVDFGGGLRSDEAIERAFDAGAIAVSIGSVAIKEPEKAKRWISKYGTERFILSADVLDGEVRISGWTEKSGTTIHDLLNLYYPLGIRNVLCTDISRDGMLSGPDIDLYKDIMKAFPDCCLIASGGIRDVDDIRALDRAGIPAVVFGKAIYEGRINMKTLLNDINE